MAATPAVLKKGTSMTTRLGILSDTHSFLHPALETLFAGVDGILHAGDIGTTHVLTRLQAIAPTIAVRGNIDGESFYELKQLERRHLGGKWITIVHNAGDILRPAFDLHSRILHQPSDLLISGHYHGYWCQTIQNHNAPPTLWISPGAAGNAGHHAGRTALLLTIADPQHQDGSLRDFQLEKIDLGPRGS